MEEYSSIKTVEDAIKKLDDIIKGLEHDSSKSNDSYTRAAISGKLTAYILSRDMLKSILNSK